MARVQTFLPYRDFARSAAVLDQARLGKQRVETLQVLRALELPDYGWQHHPAVLMWRGRTPALVAYGLECVAAWTARGHADSTRDLIAEFAPEVLGRSQADLAEAGMLPRWLGNGALHLSHRSALVRKDAAYYRAVFGDVPDDLPYVWPDADAPAGPAGTEQLPVPPAGDPLWVVRPPQEAAQAWLDGGLVALTDPRGRTSPKWRRQVAAFREEVRPGDAVALLLDGGTELVLGTVSSDVAEEVAGHLTRRVEWSGQLPRSAVTPPASLQDPRSLFRVRVRGRAAARRG
jgi:hypothetical protein